MVGGPVSASRLRRQYGLPISARNLVDRDQGKIRALALPPYAPNDPLVKTQLKNILTSLTWVSSVGHPSALGVVGDWFLQYLPPSTRGARGQTLPRAEGRPSEFLWFGNF